MKIFLCPNGFTEQQAEQARHCVSLLEACGHSCAVSLEDSRRLYHTESRSLFGPAESHLIVSLGGDGAVLRAAQIALSCGKALLGVNSGRLGFLCAMDYRGLSRFSESFSSCRLSYRSLLTLQMKGKRLLALNDVVIAKENFGQTVELSVRIRKTDELHLRGDGLILATPTGSTGYSLSAGGPILDSESRAILLTPICPHGSDAHCLVLQDTCSIRISGQNGNAQIFADGRYVGRLSHEISLRKAEKKLLLYEKANGIFGRISL
ncbi:MAG: NAD(+)/NADH kinase [Oscillospiraceae bacterium]|jgi:NAD+ kinase|nr:NAD(+)/NADH kinase [Oscillospiraceae bacterium]MBR4657168.1 NAD(+)/NADH kinase [Oscillospiraceae bacterium]MBR7009493.1 NAD(+)/NADH kinase [Oscillospiraceae bacterium]